MNCCYNNQIILRQMLSGQTEARSYDELSQLVCLVEGIYSQVYQKSCSVLNILKSSCDKLKCTNTKNQSAHYLSSLCPLGLYNKIWQNGASKMYYPENQLFVFEKIRGKMKHFITQFKHIRKNIRNSEKEIFKVEEARGSLKRLVKDYNQPIVYYNQAERTKNKKVLSQKFSQYIESKKTLISETPTREKLIVKMDQLYNWLHGQIEDGLAKSVASFDKLGDGLVVILRQFFYYTIDSAVKQMQRLQKLKDCNHQRKSSLNRDVCVLEEFTYEKYLSYVKHIIKNVQEEIKVNEITYAEIRLGIEGMASIKKYFEKQTFQINVVVQKINSICSNMNFFKNYRVALGSIVNMYCSCIQSFQTILEQFQDLQKIDVEQDTIINNLKKLLSKENSKHTLNFPKLKQTIDKQISHIEELRTESNNLVFHVFTTSMNRFYEQVRLIDLELSNSQKSLELSNDVHISSILLSKEKHKWKINTDENLEKQILSILDQTFTPVQFQKENPQKSYSCALEGKILLSGRLKLYSNVICFQSVFNQKNLFFGNTFLTIPRSQIKEVVKDTMLLVPNTIKIETKKGPIIITSLFNRDKTFIQVENVINGKQLVRTNSAQQCEIEQVEIEPVEEFVIDDQELQKIQQKSSCYEKSLREKRSLVTFQTKITGLTIQEIFHELYSQSNTIVHNKKTYKNFKQYILLNNHNFDMNIQPLIPSPPKFYEPSSAQKLSEVIKSQRVLKYKHEVGSAPIPFMPKFGTCTQKQIYYWISDKMIVIDSQTFTEGIPYSDCLVVRHRTIIEKIQSQVSIVESADIEWVKSTSLKKLIQTSLQKQLKKSGVFVHQQIQLFCKRLLSNRRVVRAKSSVIQKGQEGRELCDVDVVRHQEGCKCQLLAGQFDRKISAVRNQNRQTTIILVISFLIALFLSRYI